MHTRQKLRLFNDSRTRIYAGSYLNYIPIIKGEGYAPISVQGVLQRLRDTVARDPSESLGDHIDIDTGDVLVLYKGRVKFDTHSPLLQALRKEQVLRDRSGTLEASLWDTIDGPELSVAEFNTSNGKPLTRDELNANKIWEALIPDDTTYGIFDDLFRHGNLRSHSKRKNYGFQLSLPPVSDVPTFRPLRVTYRDGAVSVTNYMGLNNATTRIVGVPASDVPVKEIPIELEEDDGLVELSDDDIVPFDFEEDPTASPRPIN